MTRNFDPARPVPASTLRHLVDLASRAPSAGKTQGWHLIVLEGADTSTFWDTTLPAERRAGFAWPGLLAAPIVALVLADPQAYVDRYGEPDKAATGWGEGIEAWSAPYWTIDTAMAAMTLLLAAEDVGLGTLFFAVSRNEDILRERLRIPSGLELLGAVAIGFPAESADQRSGRSVGRRRRPPEEIIHLGRW
jgi:nitroreductase